MTNAAQKGATPETDAVLDGWIDRTVEQSRLIPADVFAAVRDKSRALESQRDILSAAHLNQAKTIRELTARLSQCERDALRYRWLRDHASEAPSGTPTVSSAPGINSRHLLEGDDLDAAIDAALPAPSQRVEGT